VFLALLAALGVGCNLFNDLGNAWCMASGGGGAGGGSGDGGATGFGGAGGTPGFGGSGSGVGVGAGAGPGMSVGVGAGAGPNTGVGVGAGAGPGAGAGGGMARAIPHGHGPRVGRPHHRGRHENVGTARQADCPSLMQPPPAVPEWIFPPEMIPGVPLPNNAIPLTTMRLRFIADKQGIGVGKTGIQLNQAYGLAFQNWVLFMLEQKENRTPIDSPARKNRTGGLPASVIPDYVTDLKAVFTEGNVTFDIPGSRFGEVKAVTGVITLGTSQWQILGLIDVTSRAPANTPDTTAGPRPELVFTTTGNTAISPAVALHATVSRVAIWQQMVYEVPIMPADPNPDLCIGERISLNPTVYGKAIPVAFRTTTTCSKLNAPTTQLTPIPGDPDPPEVD
jgi:hypothetical protein